MGFVGYFERTTTLLLGQRVGLLRSTVCKTTKLLLTIACLVIALVLLWAELFKAGLR